MTSHTATMGLQRVRPRAAATTLNTLYGLRAFRERLTVENAYRRRGGGTFSVLFLELDRRRFEARLPGPVLSAATDLLLRNVRASDCVCHWGGKRFAFLAPSTTLSEATGFAVKLRRLICEYPAYGAGDEVLRASLGVAESASRERIEPLLDRCERALRQASAAGGDRVAIDRGD